MSNLNEHDITKSMLNVIREGGLNNKDSANKPEEEDLDISEYKKQQEVFRNQVTSSVQFGHFKLYPKTNNAVFFGTLTDCNVDFQMVLSEEDGLFIKSSESTQTKLTDNTLNVLNHLRGFYKNWKKEWQEKMQTEYKIR